MTPIEFKEQTQVIGKDQPEYKPLPAHVHPGPVGQLTCCWKLSWWERVQLLFTGRLWQSVLTFHGPLQPQLLTVVKPEMEDD